MIVLKDIEMTLDPASVDRAIREIEAFEDKLKPAMECLINYLTEKGVEVAKAALLFIGGSPNGWYENPAYDTGQLQDSIESVPFDGEAGYVKTDVPYAIYVEYGTGPMGQLKPHPLGGTYRRTKWKYYNDRIGRVVFTYGMGARPFMYNTFRDLEEEAETKGAKIVAEYLRGERA